MLTILQCCTINVAIILSVWIHIHQTEYLTIDVATHVVLIIKQFKQLHGLCWLRVIPTDVLKSAW